MVFLFKKHIQIEVTIITLDLPYSTFILFGLSQPKEKSYKAHIKPQKTSSAGSPAKALSGLLSLPCSQLSR